MQGASSLSADREAADWGMAQPEKGMSRLPMLENIFGQPESLRRLLAFHLGEGSARLRGCVEQIRKAEGRLIFTGMGASLFAAISAVAPLVEHGFAAQVVESAELLHYGSANLRRSDVAILISRSGGSVEVLRLAENLRAVGVTIVGVTNVPGSELERVADSTLLIGSQADQLVAVQTYTGTVLALLLLAEQVIAGDTAGLAEACATALPALRTLIDDCHDASEAWQEWLDSYAPLYLLGRGPSLASAYEGALLLHETAKAAAVSMSCGQFRHGPVEAVSDIFAPSSLARWSQLVRWIALWPMIFPHGREGSLDRSLAVDGVVHLRWFNGPTFRQRLRRSSRSCRSVRGVSSCSGRGIVPGDFRYASEITAAESGFPLFQAKLAEV